MPLSIWTGDSCRIYGTPCGRAMNWLHGIVSVVHRDLKPDNVFIQNATVGKQPTAKLLDFGISKSMTYDFVEQSRLTNTGMVMGAALIPLADRWGRRPIFLLCFGGYATFTLATAFVTSPIIFAATQFVAKMLMVNCSSIRV